MIRFLKRFCVFTLSCCLTCVPCVAEGEVLETPDVETASSGYRSRFKGKTGAWFLKRQEDSLLSLLPPPREGARILDVGGGHGQYTRRLIDAGYAVTVLGSTCDADGQIRDWVRSGECAYRVGSLMSLPFEDRSFDAVISFRLLSHLRDWRRLVREACRVSSRAVILDFPVADSANILYAPTFWLKRLFEGNSTRTFQVFRRREVEEVIRERGFAVTGMDRAYFLPMVVHRTLRCRGVSRAVEGFFRRVGLTGRFGSPVVLRAERNPAGAETT